MPIAAPTQAMARIPIEKSMSTAMAGRSTALRWRAGVPHCDGGQEYRTARGARENVEKNLKDSSIRHPNLSPSLRYPIVVDRSIRY